MYRITITIEGRRTQYFKRLDRDGIPLWTVRRANASSMLFMNCLQLRTAFSKAKRSLKNPMAGYPLADYKIEECEVEK